MSNIQPLTFSALRSPDDYVKSLSADNDLGCLLHRGAFGVIFGDGGIGKSYFALQLAASFASGRPFIGDVKTTGKILYVSLVDDRCDLDFRIHQAATNFSDVEKRAFEQRFCTIVNTAPFIRDLFDVDDKGMPTPNKNFDALRKTCLEVENLDAIFIDDMQAMAMINPNHEKAVWAMSNHLKILAREAQVAVILLASSSPKNDIGRAILGPANWIAELTAEDINADTVNLTVFGPANMDQSHFELHRGPEGSFTSSQL